MKGLGKKTGAAAVGETVAGGYSYPDSSSTHPDVVALGTKVGQHCYESEGAHVDTSDNI